MKLPLIFWTLAAIAYSQETQVKACAVLIAGPAASDTDRIQQSLNLCSPGQAVILKANGANPAFHCHGLGGLKPSPLGDGFSKRAGY